MISVKDTDSQINGDKESPREPDLAGPLLPEQDHDEDDDIHLYTRIRILGVSLRISPLASPNNQMRERQILVNAKDLEDVSLLVRKLAKDLHLGEEDFRSAISEFLAHPTILVKDAMVSEKVPMMPVGPFEQGSTQTISEEAEGEDEEHHIRQPILLPLPHPLSSRHKDPKVDKTWSSSPQSSTKPKVTTSKDPLTSNSWERVKRCRRYTYGGRRFWKCHKCHETWTTINTQCCNCGHLPCWQFTEGKIVAVALRDNP